MDLKWKNKRNRLLHNENKEQITQQVCFQEAKITRAASLVTGSKYIEWEPIDMAETSAYFESDNMSNSKKIILNNPYCSVFFFSESFFFLQ